MPDARAYGWCSLGPLTEDPSSTFADDQLQGSGIIKTKGTVNLQGIHRPAPGTPVSFGYSDGQNWLARIPRRLRVLSSVPNPLTLTTEVSVGCLFTYFENRQPALKNPTARAENSSVPDVAWKAATLPISAAYVFQQCCTALGLTVSGGIPLTNAYVVDEFDLSAGYIEEMGKLAVSEGWFVRLNEAEQVVFVSKQQEGGSGPLLQRGDLIDFNPVNVGDLPGEAVIARYTTSRLVPPPIDSSTPVQEGTRIMQARNWEYDSSTQIGVAVESRQVDGKLVSTFYYYNQIDETRTNYNDKELATSRVNTRTTILAALASSYTAQTGSNGGAAGTFETRTTYEYDTDGELKEEREIEYAPEAALVGGAVNQYTFPDGNVSIGMGQSIQKTSTTRYARNKEENITKTYITEQVARGQTAWGAAQISEASQQATTANEAQGVLGLALGLVPGTNVVKTHIGRGYGTQKRPGAAQRTAEANSKAGTNAPTVEETAEISWVLGSPAAETFIELSPPYAPDDRIVYSPSAPNPNAYLPGDFSVIRSDADVKATNYARIENRLLLGNRNGSGVQILPELLPPEPFAPVYVRLNGCTAEFRVNGPAWTISADGATCTSDLLFWNAVDASDFANVWFPSPPGISSLPSPVPVTPSANPLPANAVAIPAGFDLNRPDLATLFGTILPSGVAPVWANSAAPAVGYPPYNETVELRGGVGVGGVIEALQWAPTEVELIGGVGVGAVVEPISVVVLADGGAMQLSGAAATIRMAMTVSGDGGRLAISGAEATITASGQTSVIVEADGGSLRLSGGAATITTSGNLTRAAGLHFDGNLDDVEGGTYTPTSSWPVTFITTGQKYGSGAVVFENGGIQSQPSYTLGTYDFTFRFWVKPVTTSFMLAAGRYVSASISFGVHLNNGQVLIMVKRDAESPILATIGAVTLSDYVYIEFGRTSGVLSGSVNGIVSSNTIDYADNLGTTWFDVGFYSSMIVDEFEFFTGGGPRLVNFTPPTGPFS